MCPCCVSVRVASAESRTPIRLPNCDDVSRPSEWVLLHGVEPKEGHDGGAQAQMYRHSGVVAPTEGRCGFAGKHIGAGLRLFHRDNPRRDQGDRFDQQALAVGLSRIVSAHRVGRLEAGEHGIGNLIAEGWPGLRGCAGRQQDRETRERPDDADAPANEPPLPKRRRSAHARRAGGPRRGDAPAARANLSRSERRLTRGPTVAFGAQGYTSPSSRICRG